MLENLNRIRPVGYYTVALGKIGFPIYFRCPICKKLHSFPGNAEEARFQDPGEASQYFELAFSLLATWEYVTEEKMLELCNG